MAINVSRKLSCSYTALLLLVMSSFVRESMSLKPQGHSNERTIGKTIGKILTKDSRPDIWRNIGDEVVMNCTVLSGGSVRWIKWRKGGKVFRPTSQGSSWSAVVIPGVNPSDAGLYKCVVRGRTKDVSQVHLHVRVKPMIDRCSPTPIVMGAGQSVTVSCYATGEPKPSFQWLKNGKPIVSKWGTSYLYMPRANGMDLNIIGIGKSEDGVYTCVAKNKLGHASCKMEISSIPDDRSFCYHPPQVTAAQSKIEAPTGSDVSLSCVGRHVTRAMSFVYWTFGGKDISRSHKYHIVNSFYTVDKGHYRVAMVNTTLSIKHVSAETDSGPYTCQMMSEHRDEASKEVTLIVLTQDPRVESLKRKK